MSGGIGPDSTARTQVVELGSDLAAATTLQLETRWRVGPAALPVPQAVIVAIRDAAAEALRNVRRHSGQDGATLDVVLTRRGVTVTVTDQGIGFDAAAAPSSASGVGIGVSILARMRTAGGQASVSAVLGEGTTVLLTWWRESLNQSRASWHALAASSLPGANRRFRLLCLPPLVAQTFATLLHADRPSQWVAMAAMVVISFAVAWLLDTRAPLRQELAATHIVVGIIVFVGVIGLPARAFTFSEAPITGFAALPLCLLALCIRWWEALLSVVPTFAFTVLAVVLRPDLGVSPPIFIVTPLTVMAVWTVGDRLRRTAADSEAGQQVYLDQVARRAWLGEVADVQVARLAVVATTVEPFMQAVAAGDDEISDAQRIEAGLLAAAVRDQLSWPVELPREALRSLREARAQGVAVILRPVDDPAVAAAAPWPLFLHVAGIPGVTRVTISHGVGWRLAILPGLGDEAAAALLTRWPSATLVTEPARTVLTVPGPEGGTPPEAS